MTWELLWAFGRYDLGLTEAEFWALTPMEFHLLSERRIAQVRWRDLRAALAPWMMSVLWTSRKAKRLGLQDLMVINIVGKDNAAPHAQDPAAASQQLQAKCHAAFIMLAESARANKTRGV